MRRRPTAVYRVVDEDDLLPRESALDADDWSYAEGEQELDLGAPAGDAAGGPTQASERGHEARGRVLAACAGTLVLAFLIARAAGALLGGGSGGAHAGGRLARAPRAAVAASSRPPARPPAVVVAAPPVRGAPAPKATRPSDPPRGPQPPATSARSAPVGGDARRYGSPRPRQPGVLASGVRRGDGAAPVRVPAVPAGDVRGGHSSSRAPRPAVPSAIDQEFGFER